jgi:acetyltransferase-like isoleucine patch superfamily enzyme
LRQLVIGNDVVFAGQTYIRIRKEGRIVLGDRVRTGPEVWLVAANACEFRVGDDTVLGTYVILNGGHGLTIGSDCVFAGFVYVNTSDHGIDRGHLIREQAFTGAPIHIGQDVWLGGHSFINKGVSIGNGAVIGAGAIVTNDVASNVIAVGNPARVLRERE